MKAETDESVLSSTPAELLPRLLGASYALPVEKRLRDIADDVAGWDAEGATAREIDSRIRSWMNENGFTYESWKADLEAEQQGLFSEYPEIDPVRLWHVYGLEEWLIECVRSLAFTDQPIPFIPWATGMWIELSETDPPMLVAIMTPLCDPDVTAKQLKKKARKVFGNKAARNTRKNEVENARMLRLYKDGMKLRDIAIQNLRNEYSDVLTHEYKYKKDIRTEKDRVRKCISAAEALWKERLSESSIV